MAPISVDLILRLLFTTSASALVTELTLKSFNTLFWSTKEIDDKAFISLGLFNLVFSYSLRYVNLDLDSTNHDNSFISLE